MTSTFISNHLTGNTTKTAFPLKSRCPNIIRPSKTAMKPSSRLSAKKFNFERLSQNFEVYFRPGIGGHFQAWIFDNDTKPSKRRSSQFKISCFARCQRLKNCHSSPLPARLIKKSLERVERSECRRFQVHGQNEKFTFAFRQLRLLAAKIGWLCARESSKTWEDCAIYSVNYDESQTGRRLAVMRDDAISLNFSSPPFLDQSYSIRRRIVRQRL